jgi:hypothetical protein
MDLLLIYKNPRGKPSRYRSTFSYLESGVLIGCIFSLFTPQGVGNKTPRDLKKYFLFSVYFRVLPWQMFSGILTTSATPHSL